MSACERVQLDLAELLGGELAPARAAEVEAHLATCDACRAEAAELRSVLGALATDVAPDPGERYWQTFAGRVRTARATRDRAAPRRSWLGGWAPRLALAASIALLAVVALREPQPEGGESEEDALFVEMLAPSLADSLVELADEEELDALEALLAAGPRPKPTPTPAAPPKKGATPKPKPAPAPDADESRSTGAVYDELDDLTPEQLKLLLEKLEAMET